MPNRRRNTPVDDGTHRVDRATKANGSSRAGPETTSIIHAEQRLATVEAELRATEEHLRAIIDEHQGTNEQLLSANEELVSSNEELHCLNEEMETAREELRSTNEELSTLNEQLHERNAELASVNSDLMNILGSVEVPIVIVDAARRIRRFTPKARPILNLLPSDVGRPIDDIRPNLAIARLDQKIGEVVDTLRMREEEVEGRDGRWYRLQIRPYTTADNRIDGAVLSIVDIDALKRALGAAEWARDYARATVDAVQVPLVVLDRRMRLVSVNGACHEVYRLRQDEAEGKSLYEVLNGAWNIGELRSAVARVLQADGRFSKIEVEREIPAIGQRFLSFSGRSVAAPGGERMVLLAIEDITERLRGDAERMHLLEVAEAAKASAEEANRAKDIFLATLSHELRTPLTNLLMQSQLLRRGDPDPARVRRAVEVIERAAKAQAQLIDDLLDISRIVTGKLKMHLQSVSLTSVVQSAMEAVAPIAEKKRIEIELDLDESLAHISGDAVRLQQVVWNLVINAIKFTPDHGRIVVTVDAAGDHGRICVSDTGIGIEPAFLPQIFNRFSQEERGHTRSHGGLGLGLAIVRYLVEAHGGTVQAESPGRGKGTRFTVLLPLMRAEANPRPAAAPDGEHAAAERGAASGSRVIRNVRVLLVEDDAGTREALTDMLALSGAEVRSAGSAAKAMNLFEELPPDVLISDVALPEEDGLGLIARIRALGPRRGGDVPAIALTAHAGEDDRRRAFAAGFQIHIAKPVDIDTLVAALVRLLRKTTAHAGAEEHGLEA